MESVIRILYLEDDPNDVELAEARLREAERSIELVHVTQRADFEGALAQGSFDLVLADYALPAFDGLTALAIVREQYLEIPFVLVTGQLGEELAIESLKAGATDYVLKQNLRRLAPAVERALREANERRVRVQAETEARRLAVAIDQAAESVVVLDPGGSIQYVNPAFEQVSGRARSEVLGRDMRILLGEARNDATAKNIWDSIKSGEVWAGRLVNTTKAGARLEEDVSISPVLNDDGAIINYVCVLRDITMQSAMERKLRQAQKLEALGTLAGGISHDFNNILTAILGYTEMAAVALPESSQERQCLDQALTAAHRAKKLVRQILTFSRQRQHKVEPVLLYMVIDEALELIRASLPSTIEVRTDIEQMRDVVFADATELYQVVLNLCTNAGQAMDETGGVLDIGLSTIEADDGFLARQPDLCAGRYAKLTVRDSGCGMDRETLGRIFDPFFTTKGEGEGTGMGLATVHGIVQMCGGALSVQSEPEIGTSFEVYFPISDISVTSPVTKAATAGGGQERILVVDDDELLASLVGDQLRRSGYDVFVKTSSFEALQALRAKPSDFDLIITDEVMPELRGKDLLREAALAGVDIPGITMSGNSAGADEEPEASTVRTTHLEKPFTLKALTRTVRTALDEAKATKESAAAGHPVLSEPLEEVAK